MPDTSADHHCVFLKDILVLTSFEPFHQDISSLPASLTLREKCLYSEFFWSAFSHILTRKTLITDTFHAL